MITREVLESHLHCKYKAYLKQAGQEGVQSDYAVLLAEARATMKQRAVDRIVARHGAAQVARDLPLCVSSLTGGPLYILDPVLEDGSLSVRFDGLKRVDGPSSLGEFHYIPMLFSAGRQVRKEQKALLDVFAMLLSRVQGRTPAGGIVWHGKECRMTRIPLRPDLQRAQLLLRELRQDQASQPPRLVLNDHCQVCEFRQRCHQQALQEDNLSLLRGMREKEVKAYVRKGILSISQLSQTFHPRRQSKRRAQRMHRRYHALQALAIRDKKVYVFGSPTIPDNPAQIYLDMEGDPEEDYVYLIGVIVARDGVETSYSFWADGKEQEQAIFEQFLAEVSRFKDASVFCYGSYEYALTKQTDQRIRKAS